MLLVHACCADCCLKLQHTLSQDNYQINQVDYYFDNPNIHPESEWHARRMALKNVLKDHPGKLIIQPWQPKNYFYALGSIAGNHPQQGKRCPSCWLLRLESTAKYASKNGYDSISSTLLMSHYQDQTTIRNIAATVAKQYQLELYLPQSSLAIKTKGFYKQNYCGCIYSLKERLEEKFLKDLNK